jgi:hypothetical protein
VRIGGYGNGDFAFYMDKILERKVIDYYNQHLNFSKLKTIKIIENTSGIIVIIQ